MGLLSDMVDPQRNLPDAKDAPQVAGRQTAPKFLTEWERADWERQQKGLEPLGRGVSTSAPREGFHWTGGWYFQRLPDGSVWVRRHYQEGASDLYDIGLTIPAPQWASIVASVSSAGETGNAWEAALTFHNRTSHPAQSPGRPVPHHGSGPDDQ